MLLTKEDNSEIKVYNEIVKDKGGLIFSIAKDSVEHYKFFVKEEDKINYIENNSLSMIEFIVSSKSFNIIKYLLVNDEKYIRSINTKDLISILLLALKDNDLSLIDKKFISEKIITLSNSIDKKRSIYINGILYADEEIIYIFKNLRKYIVNENVGSLISSFETGKAINTIAYKNNLKKRVELIYEELLELNKKRKINMFHYINTSYFGDETEIFRIEFFKYLSEKYRDRWIKYLFENTNLIYHTTVFAEDISKKYCYKNKDDKNLNLEFIFFLSNYVIPDISSRGIKLSSKDIKKLKMFLNVINKISKNFNFFEQIISLKEINSFILEWELNKKIKNRKILKEDRISKKI